MSFQPSQFSYGAAGGMDLDTLLALLRGSHVQTPEDFELLASRALDAVTLEKGAAVSMPSKKEWQTLRDDAVKEGRGQPANMSPSFGRLSDWAAFSGGRRTAEALALPTEWFLVNVVGTALEEGLGKAPLTKQPWFWPTLVVGVVGLIGGMLVWPRLHRAG